MYLSFISASNLCHSRSVFSCPFGNMITYLDFVLRARPLLWTKNFRFGGGSKHITTLREVMSMPSLQTLVAIIRLLVLFRRSFKVSFCSLVLMRSLIFETRAWWFDVPTNVPIRRISFVTGWVANRTDNNFTEARVFTKTIAADPGDISWASTWMSWRALGERLRSCEIKRISIAKEIANVNLFPLVHVLENAEWRLPLSLELEYA